MLARCDWYRFLISLQCIFLQPLVTIEYLRYWNVENPGAIGLRLTCDYLCGNIEKTKLYFYINIL